jgi:hypothetical protein
VLTSNTDGKCCLRLKIRRFDYIVKYLTGGYLSLACRISRLKIIGVSIVSFRLNFFAVVIFSKECAEFFVLVSEAGIFSLQAHFKQDLTNLLWDLLDLLGNVTKNIAWFVAVSNEMIWRLTIVAQSRFPKPINSIL